MGIVKNNQFSVEIVPIDDMFVLSLYDQLHTSLNSCATNDILTDDGVDVEILNLLYETLYDGYSFSETMTEQGVAEDVITHFIDAMQRHYAGNPIWKVISVFVYIELNVTVMVYERINYEHKK